MASRCQHTLKKFNKDCINFNTASILGNISYTYCNNYRDLIATVLNLRNIVSDDPQLKLIVIDSFSFILRQIEDVSLRTRVNYEILTDLQSLAFEFSMSVMQLKCCSLVHS